MQRALAWSLVVAIATTACQPRTSPTPVVRSPKALAASPVASALPAPRLLQKPRESYATLAGSVKLDGAYIVAQGGGNLVGASGAQVVAAGGGTIISTNGGGIISTNGGGIISGNGSAVISGNGSAIISTNGGGIVAQGGGNIISGNGSAIVAQGGGNIVAQGGGNIVAQGGGNIISTNGGGIISGNGSAVISGNGSAVISGNGSAFISGTGSAVISGTGSALAARPAQRSLLAAAAAQVPVAGMPVGLFSLATHQEIPVGVDLDGKAVYTVYTDLQGRFELFPPSGETGNVLVVAHVQPQSQDPRFHVALVTPARAGADLDEDSTALTALIRTSFVRRLERILVAKDEEVAGVTQDLLGEFPDLPKTFSAPLADMVTAMHANASSAHLPGLPPEQVQPLAQRVADLMVRELELQADAEAAIKIVVGSGPPTPYFPAMLAAFARCRAGAAEHDQAYFDAQPWFQTVQERRKGAGLAPNRIQKPADFNAFVTDAYFAEADPRALAAKAASAATPDLFGILDVVMRSVGVADQVQTVRYAHNALLTGLMFKFVEGQSCDASLRHRVGDMIRGGLSGSPPPVPTRTCEPG
ncbi:MAG: hypothetical protein JWM80_6662 [Cyanobacteria bacterium RYN_339]|nr:hypothetical protein [Cyanobacteria bacterium RYN_339]